jgi:hypothetical protein
VAAATPPSGLAHPQGPPGRSRRIGDGRSPVRASAIGAGDGDHGGVQSRKTALAGVIVCLECEEHSNEARGWKAFLDEELELLVYCAACAEREFGED